MADFSSEALRMELTRIGNRTRDLCAKRVPEEIGHYTGSQLRMIERVYALTRNTSEGIQLKMLARELDITPAAASEMVETLVRRNALERKSDPNDRRAVSLRLAPEWDGRFHYFEDQLNLLYDRFFANTPESDRDITFQVLRKLADFLNCQDELPEVQ